MKSAVVTMPAVNVWGTEPEEGLTEPVIEVDVDLSAWPEERPTIPVGRQEYVQRLSDSDRYAVSS